MANQHSAKAVSDPTRAAPFPARGQSASLRVDEKPPAKLEPKLLFPREHGSWGMLLFPFVSAVILARDWSWDLLPASVALLAVFLVREPLAVLARQRFVWKTARAESVSARRTLLGLGLALALAGAWLLIALPWGWVVGMGAAALAVTAGYVLAIVRNRQRAVGVQLLGAFGLTGSCVLAYLAAGRQPDKVLALLYAVHVVHSTGAVLVVRARLEALAALRKSEMQRSYRSSAIGWQIVQALGTVALVATGRLLLASALALPWLLHTADLLRLDRENFLRIPPRQIGFRELGLSVVVSALTIAALWAG